MNTVQIRDFVMKYIEAEQCDIIEKHPAYVTVKLSPSADKDLTNRSYYWSFVERTGAPAETVSLTLVFDPDKAADLRPVAAGTPAGGYPTSGVAIPAPGAAVPTSGVAIPTSGVAIPAPGGYPTSGAGSVPAVAGTASAPGAAPAPGEQPDSVLGRYFGFVPNSAVARIPRDDVTFGSRRLEQIFGAVRAKGRFVRLFEEPPGGYRSASSSLAYTTWFYANYKVEFACDMKRSELHSLGIKLSTGEIREEFHDRLTGLKLTPKLPANIHLIPDKMSIGHAVNVLEKWLEQELKQYDHTWAEEAHDRLLEELARIRNYYENLLRAADDNSRPDIDMQYRNRQAEIEWQYRPRVQTSVINCGLIHLIATNEA